ncbi:putative ribonuclease H-like domain-containing protein, partial [Tanacetum coccineum]
MLLGLLASLGSCPFIPSIIGYLLWSVGLDLAHTDYHRSNLAIFDKNGYVFSHISVPSEDYILLPLWTQDPSFSSSSKDSPDTGFKPSGEEEKKDTEDPGNESGNPLEGKNSEVPSIVEPRIYQEKDASVNNTNNINTVSPTVNAASIEDNVVDENIVYGCADDPNMPDLEEIGRFSDAEDDSAEADMTNFGYTYPCQSYSNYQNSQGSSMQQRTNHKDFQNCLFACFLSQEEPKKVWTLVDLLNGKRAIGTKWVYMNKKDERGIVIRNKARLVTQGHTQEEGIDYDEVFALVVRIEAIRVEKALYGLHQALRAWYETLSTYLLENRFQRGQIDKTLVIKRDQGDILIVQVYVDDISFGFIKKKLCIEFEKMMHKKFQMSSIGELTFFLGLQVKQKEDGIFLSQDKYVTEILKIFGFSDVKTASTPMETHKPLLKDADGEDVDEHLYRSMIGSLMYLTSSRPDIMFAVCACARFQVNPKVSHLHAMKRIFRYLKGQPKLGLWYPKDSPFDLVAFTDSDYAGASLDRKSTTGGCQFLRCRLISWQCKKQTVVANSIIEAEYIAASNCCRQ